MREKLASAIQKRFYNVQPLEETDRILRDELGITLGGQLDMATAAQLREALQVEGLLYGTLMNFEETTTGLVNVRKVRGKFNIVETNTDIGFLGKWYRDQKSGHFRRFAVGVLRVQSRTPVVVDEEVPWVVIESTSSNKSIMDGLCRGIDQEADFKSSGCASGPGNRRNDLAARAESAMGRRGCRRPRSDGGNVPFPPWSCPRFRCRRRPLWGT